MTLKFAHTCYRVKDLDSSVRFYTSGLGLVECERVPIGDEALNVFLGPDPTSPCLELTFNFGRKAGYELGTGYGHLALEVADLDHALERLHANGVEPERPPYRVSDEHGRLCFVRDPDGYRIELIEPPRHTSS